MKKITGIILAFSMLMSILPTRVVAYSSEYDFLNCVDGFVSGYYGSSPDMTIPDTIYGDEVVGIELEAFSYNETIQSVTMPDAVTSIGFNAFQGCTNLTSIEISPNIRDIGADAFLNTGIYNNAANWENGVLYIDNCLIKAKPTVSGKYSIKPGTEVIAAYAFDGCYNITDIEIPSSVRYIGDEAFSSTEFINSPLNYTDGALYRGEWLVKTYPYDNILASDYTIKDGTTKIAGGAFKDNDDIKSITLPEGVTTICHGAFFSTENLTKINFPDSLEIIGYQAFCGSGVQVLKGGENLREIDRWAFEECNNLERVEFPDGFYRIRYGAFMRCENLKTLVIPDSMWKIAGFAFDDCKSLEEVFYSGTTAMWKKLIEINELEYEEIAEATVYFTYEVPDFTPVYVPVKINEVKINGKGTAYARFVLEDKTGGVARNKTVYYSIDGAPKKSARTDLYGCVRIPVENVTGSGTFRISITGADIQAVVGTLKVTVEPLKFSSAYEGKILAGARVGLNAGVGAEVSELEAEASAAEAGAGLSEEMFFSVSQEYENNKNKLTITAKRSGQFALDAKVGLFAGITAGDIAGIEGKAGELSGKAALGTMIGMSMQDEDFDVKNQTDLENVGKFVLCCSFENLFSNAFARYLAEKLEVPVNSYEKGDTVALEGGASLCVVDVKSSDGVDLGEFDLGGIGVKSVWENSTVTNADNSTEYKTSLAAESGISLLDFKKKNLRGTNLEGGSSVWGTSFINDELSMTAKEDKDGTLKEICFTATENKDDSVFWYKQTSARKMNFTYSDEAADALVENNTSIEDFAKGWRPYFFVHEWEGIADTVINSDTNGEYNSTSEYKQGFDVDISAKIKCLGDLGINVGVSGIEGYEYDTENGIVENNTIYVQAKNDIKEDVEDEFLGVDEICALAIAQVAKKVEGLVENAVAVLDETVDGILKSGQAAVQKIGDGITDFKVSITNTIDEIGSMSILAVDNEAAPYSAASLATTVGNPYAVNVENADGEKVTEFNENPLLLTLEYTDEQLSAAGVYDENELHIMYWDDAKCVYVNKGGELDAENNNMSLEISKSGQYVLAVDNCPPAITEFASGDEGKSPEISAVVSDMSGISDFSLKIDGEEVVNMENLEDFYDYTTGDFNYIANGLSDGQHYASISVSDTLSNSIEEELWFNVVTTAPVIEEVSVPDVLVPGVDVMTRITGDEPEKIFLNVEILKEDGTKRLWSEEMTGGYDYCYWAQFPQVPAGETVNIWVSVLGMSGNMAESEKKEFSLEPLEIKFGSVSISGSYLLCNNSAELEDLDVVIASYDSEGVLIMSEVVPMNEGGASFSIIPGRAAYAKAFLWRDMQPLCEIAKYEK